MEPASPRGTGRPSGVPSESRIDEATWIACSWPGGGEGPGWTPGPSPCAMTRRPWMWPRLPGGLLLLGSGSCWRHVAERWAAQTPSALSPRGTTCRPHDKLGYSLGTVLSALWGSTHPVAIATPRDSQGGKGMPPRVPPAVWGGASHLLARCTWHQGREPRDKWSQHPAWGSPCGGC